MQIRLFTLRLLCWSLAFATILAIGESALGESTWPDERRSGQFLFHADFDLTRYERLLVETSELQQDVSTTLGIPAPQEPIHLFLFSRKNIYQAYLKQYFPSVPYRRALFIKRRGPGMVFAYANRELETDVRHESTHAVLHASLTHVPLWLDEGLAEYFEVPRDKRAYENPHLGTLKREIFFGKVARIETLEKVESLEQMGTAQYRQAWGWIHFMLHGPAPARNELVRYLSDVQNAVPTGQLSERLHRAVPNLERAFIDHFQGWRR